MSSDTSEMQKALRELKKTCRKQSKSFDEKFIIYQFINLYKQGGSVMCNGT